jgi:acyl-CoA reductase-like NAD-dependent aldehyde dehydrogenase
VHKINFKVSSLTGHQIAPLAGEHLKPVTLELGGKAPMIVLEDADIAMRVEAGVFGAFHYVSHPLVPRGVLEHMR